MEKLILKYLGTFTNQTNSTECNLCDLGHYQPSKGQSGCIPCGYGSFCNKTGCLVCDDCSAGEEALDEGSEGCSM